VKPRVLSYGSMMMKGKGMGTRGRVPIYTQTRTVMMAYKKEHKPTRRVVVLQWRTSVSQSVIGRVLARVVVEGEQREQRASEDLWL
jgi:hypothetical protein